MKEALISEVQIAALPFTHSMQLLSELFDYKEEIINLTMEYSNTGLWPSEANIVSLSHTAVCFTTVASHVYQ